MNLSSTPGSGRFGRNELFVVACVTAVILLVLFHRSFEANQTLFSNDNPLGLIMAYNDVAPSLFTGHWHPFNWIGSREPSALPTLSYTLYLLWGAVVQSKLIVPVALFVLGLGAWLFLRELGLSRWTCVLGGIAAMLNTDPFSYSCWGLPSLAISMAATFFALAAAARLSGPKAWVRLVLAGFALGMAIMEGFDNGAIFSLYVAAFVLFRSWAVDSEPGRGLLRGVVRVGLVAVCAAIIAAHGLATLVGTQIQGIAGMGQDDKSKDQRWDEATMWSLPKIETLRLIVPGLFGYRMDTPDGGCYWGAVGQRPGIPQTRHSGAGVYAGVLVVLLASLALAQASRAQSSPFSTGERRTIYFWAGAAVISLLLAYGRHAPFYQFFYKLPYMSTIRNPIKFMHPFTISIVVVFAYGVEALWRQYLSRTSSRTGSIRAQVTGWWKAAAPFERRWSIATLGLLVVAGLGCLLYVSSRRELEGYLQSVASPQLLPASLVPSVAAFSMMEAGWFVLFLALGVGAVILILSGVFSGSRARWGLLVLGALLLADFFRANSPWIIYYDYADKYAPNPILDILRDQPQEHRVAVRLAPLSGGYLASREATEMFAGMVDQEWLQRQFPYYHVQSLDIVQMPRIPEMDLRLMKAMAPTATQVSPIARLWQLTNTRYILGMKGFLDTLNQQVDPTNQSFRVKAAFDFAPKHADVGTRAEDFTAVTRAEGAFAVFEFGAALPRAKLFSQWEIATNDTAAVNKLADPAFDPQKLVLVSDAIPAVSPTTAQTNAPVTITSYKPKHVLLRAEPAAPSILLLNDKWDPNWKVLVDGKPASLLRCNYIMRGVFLGQGKHAVEFHFDPPHGTLYVTLAALFLGLGLCAFLAVSPAPVEVRTEPKPVSLAASRK